jgi:hypothetical protein
MPVRRQSFVDFFLGSQRLLGPSLFRHGRYAGRQGSHKDVLQVQKGWTCTSQLALCSPPFVVNTGNLQIARDCPEGREVVEEDNTWGEITDDPWGGGSGTFSAEGNQAMP